MQIMNISTMKLTTLYATSTTTNTTITTISSFLKGGTIRPKAVSSQRKSAPTPLLLPPPLPP
jgi:hypothetical protein